MSRSFRLCTADGVVAMPLVTMSLPVNVFLVSLFTKGLNLPMTTIGLITALPFVCNFLQLGLSPFLSRWFAAQKVAVAGAGAQAICWAALGIMLHWIPRDAPATAGLWLAAWFFCTSFAGSLTGVAWNSWIQEWVPPRLRGSYFGRRNRVLQLSTLTFLLSAGWALARWDYAIPAFQTVIVIAVTLRLVSVRWQRILPSPAINRRREIKLSFMEQLEALHAARSFLRFVAFGAVWSFAANCFGPFYHVFMFEQLQFSAFNVGILSTLAALGGALSMPFWGQLLDRYGNKAVMTFSLILWQVQNLVWCILTPDNRELLYFMWIWGGTTSAGFVLGQFTLLLKLIPPAAKNLAIGVNLAITSLVAATAPVTGGAVLSWALGRWPDALTVYHLCFILQPVLALGGAFLLLRVHEPAASSLSSVVGAMRNIRTLGGVLGLSFLVDYVFVKTQKKT